MQPSKTEFRGAEALRLATRKIELIAPTGFGPRLLSLRSLAGGPNLLLEFPQGLDDSAGKEGFRLRGGHRLWHAPEHIVRSYQPDNGPVKVKLSRAGFRLTAATEARTGLRKSVAVEALNDRTLRITHELSNEGLWAVECAPWALTMLRHGGYGAIPLLPKGDHAAGDLLPGYSIVPWTYTDLSLPCWDLHRDFIGLDTREVPSPQKLGLTAYPGWSAYWIGGVTLVKQARVVAGATYPDLGCAFETFCDQTACEFETLGPLRALEPGKSVKHTEHWTVLDGLAKPSTDAAFSALAKAVRGWLKQLAA